MKSKAGRGEIESPVPVESGHGNVLDGEPVEAQGQPSEELSLPLLAYHRDLLVITAEVAHGTGGMVAREHRPGNHALFALSQLSSHHLGDIGAETGSNEARLPDPGPGQRNDTVGVQFSRGKEPTRRHNILEADMPNAFVPAHGVQQVYMRANVPGRMRTTERLDLDIGQVQGGQLSLAGLTDIDCTLCQLGEDPQAVDKIRLAPGEQRRSRGRQGMGVHGRDEQGVGFGLGIRHPAERTDPQGGPLPRLEQLLNHLCSCQTGQLVRGVGFEKDLTIFGDTNDN